MLHIASNIVYIGFIIFLIGEILTFSGLFKNVSFRVKLGIILLSIGVFLIIGSFCIQIIKDPFYFNFDK